MWVVTADGNGEGSWCRFHREFCECGESIRRVEDVAEKGRMGFKRRASSLRTRRRKVQVGLQRWREKCADVRGVWGTIYHPLAGKHQTSGRTEPQIAVGPQTLVEDELNCSVLCQLKELSAGF